MIRSEATTRRIGFLATNALVAAGIFVVACTRVLADDAPKVVLYKTIECETKIIGHLLLSAGGDHLAVVADFVNDGEGIKCWDVRSDKVSQHYSFSDELDGPFHSVVLSANGHGIFVCKLAESVVYELSSEGKSPVRMPGRKLLHFRHLFNTADGTPYGMGQLQTGEDLALVNLTNGVTTFYPIAPWDAWGFSAATMISPTLNAVACRLDKSQQDETVVGVFSLNKVGALDRRPRDYDFRLGKHVEYVFPMFSWDGALLAVSTSEGEVSLHDLKQKQLRWKRRVDVGHTRACSWFSSDGRVMAISTEGHLTFVRTSNGEKILQCDVEGEPCIATSPCGNFFASTGAQRGHNTWQLKLWHVN